VTPYDGSVPWAGPHATFKAALIEWIKKETFNNKPNGSFIVDESGVVRPGPATAIGTCENSVNAKFAEFPFQALQ
jgi:hypothetical protein